MNKATLKNGMNVITKNNDNYETVTLCYSFNCGSYNENEHERGIAHLVEHMLFKGTMNRTFKSISEDMENIGGLFNACTGFENTRYYCVVPSDKWKEGLEIISDVVWCNTIPEDQLEKEKQVVMEELKMYKDDPKSFVFDSMFADLFENESNRQSIGGTIESVSKITREDVMNFINKYYHPKNCCAIAAGKIMHDDFLNYVETFISDIEFKQPEVFSLTQLKKPTKMRNTKSTKDIDQSHLCFGMFAPNPNNEYDSSVDLVSVMLGGNSSSRLFTIIREEMGLAYSVRTSREYMTDCSLLMGYVGLNQQNINAVKKIITDEILKFTKEENISSEELERAKNYLTGKIKIRNESTESQVSFISDSMTYGTDLDINKYLEKMKKVTQKDIVQCMTKYCQGDFINFAEVNQKC